VKATPPSATVSAELSGVMPATPVTAWLTCSARLDGPIRCRYTSGRPVASLMKYSHCPSPDQAGLVTSPWTLVSNGVIAPVPMSMMPIR
jgi:hypothetical protein